jgi:hypothetical protein
MARATSSKVPTPGASILEVPGPAFVLSLIILVRPGPWTKTLLVFAGPGFGLRLFDPAAVIDATLDRVHRREGNGSPPTYWSLTDYCSPVALWELSVTLVVSRTV